MDVITFYPNDYNLVNILHMLKIRKLGVKRLNPLVNNRVKTSLALSGCFILCNNTFMCT